MGLEEDLKDIRIGALTGDQVIRGLQCCAQGDLFACDSCPYGELECRQGLMVDTLALMEKIKEKYGGK